MLVATNIIMRVFIKKSTYQMSIDRERITTTQAAHASLVRILSFILFSLLMKSFEEEIKPSKDRVDNDKSRPRGP